MPPSKIAHSDKSLKQLSNQDSLTEVIEKVCFKMRPYPFNFSVFGDTRSPCFLDTFDYFSIIRHKVGNIKETIKIRPDRPVSNTVSL